MNPAAAPVTECPFGNFFHAEAVAWLLGAACEFCRSDRTVHLAVTVLDRYLAVAPRAQKEPMNADGTKKRSEMTDCEIYTDGEYGRAFKFPWEVEATELTTIGHAIPAAILLSFYLVPLAYGVATGRIDLSALS